MTLTRRALLGKKLWTMARSVTLEVALQPMLLALVRVLLLVLLQLELVIAADTTARRRSEGLLEQ